MNNSNIQLPTLNEFKTEAKRLKKSEGFKKLGHAQNHLAKKYGYKDFNAIRPVLIKNENMTKEQESLNNVFSFDSEAKFDNGFSFDEKTELEEERILTVKDVKEEIESYVEYANPDDSFGFSSNISLSSGDKPFIGDKFFNTIEEAVLYEFNTGELYEEIRHLPDNAKVVERYNEDEELLPYKVYQQ